MTTCVTLNWIVKTAQEMPDMNGLFIIDTFNAFFYL